jgi:non-specific protein-tyrosine kinase
MDLHDYLRALRRHWRLVTACVLLGLAGAVAATALLPRTYTATAQLFVATRTESSGDAYQGGLFTQERVKSYTRIVTSPGVLNGVIHQLGLPTTSGQLATKVSATAPLDTTLVDIRVSDPSAVRAQRIADATAAQFTRYIGTVEGSSAGAPPLVKASVVGGSQPPSTPTSPRPALNLAIGLVCGLVVGVAGAVLRESLDTTLRSADDIGTQLALTTVGVLPPPEQRRAGSGRRAGATRRTEALNQLRTRLRFGSADGIPASVLVCSPSSAEGRTTTAIDLATTVARSGARVVLVEADLRRPHLAEALGVRGTTGLSDVLAGRATLCEALDGGTDGRIRVLPGGPVPTDPGTLLSSPEMAGLIRSLEADADLVVVDSPPLLAFAEGGALAAMTQGVLFVVRSGRTRRADGRSALDTLAAVGARVIGAVLTGTHAPQLTEWRPPEEPGRPRPDTADGRRASAADTPVSDAVPADWAQAQPVRHREQAG